MVKAVEWINQNYPAESVCQRVEDKENYGKRREEITNLDISNQNLEGSFDAPGFRETFTNLRNWNLSFNKITGGLNISHNLRGLSGSLEVLKCSDNPLTNLSSTYSSSLSYIDCFGINYDKYNTVVNTVSPTSPISMETVFVNNPNDSHTILGLAVSLGISLFAWLVLGSFFCFKRRQPILKIPSS
ncbi:753_t:CDS:2 [Funneliformis geosporum]|uniref:11799_t:CDS:1 n=1 Tax=Funneliformis geosporum TaxID=1117311 RepID=A0A9W4SHR7_9GLOM|nr:753_t:CDS:2 [Funneliformis geosporum]CAI2168979.1 11799_t:CDS:2 [Funneliformis geosporum]